MASRGKKALAGTVLTVACHLGRFDINNLTVEEDLLSTPSRLDLIIVLTNDQMRHG